MEINWWEAIGIFFAIIIPGSFIAAFIECAWEQRKRNREQAEREALWRKGESSK